MIELSSVTDFVSGSRELTDTDRFWPFRCQIRAVVFDIDGTLTDSIGQIVGCTREAFAAHSIPVPSEEVITGMIGMRLNEGLRSILPESFKGDYEAVTATYRAIFNEHDRYYTPRLFADVEMLLKTLHERGYKIGYASGKSTQGVTRTLQSTVLGDYCDAFCAGDEVPSKPHTAMMETMARRLSLPAHQILGVGDAGMDIVMYQRAHNVSCAVETGVWSGRAMALLKPNLLIPRATDLGLYLRPCHCPSPCMQH